MARTLTLHALVVSLLVITVFFRPVAEARNGSFSIELVHRESPLSPFYNPSETASNRLRNAVLRSMSRINRLAESSSTTTNLINIQSQTIPNDGDYLMKLSIGTPPVKILAIADTGSDLTWTQCKPCDQCYAQDAPLFDPKQSCTYIDISCDSNSCHQLSPGQARCGNTSSTKKNCEYLYYYGDLSHTIGVLATDSFTFDSAYGQPVSVPKIVFGCGHHNGGTFTSHGSGIVGLGGGPLSLVSQLSSNIDGKFSYCLVPMFENSTSKLNFGSQAIILGHGVVSTPLISKDPVTYYYLNLEGISVGDKRIEKKPLNLISGGSEGNIIIDSGTTLTMLDVELYNELESAVRTAINIDPTDDPSGYFNLCYNTKSNIKVPTMIFHFTGADLHLNELNTFMEVSEDLVCLAVIPSQTFSIFGIVESKGLEVLVGGPHSQNVQTSIQSTDEAAVRLFMDQLLKTVIKLSVLYVFVSPYQPFPEDIFSYRWTQPFNLQNGWFSWGVGGLIAASTGVLLIKALISGSNVSQIQNEADSLVRLLPLIGASNISNVSLLGVLGVLAPLCEETIYRGFLLTSLTKWLPVHVSVFLSSVIFTLAHQSPGNSAEIFIFGIVLGLVYTRTRNLLAPITMHACWNLGVIFILIYFQSQGDDIHKYVS
ncbi:Peptidase A1 [Macleaya cordata]|uniref:Peptidase A1 n=1 Tax=Macleaya cordata TaxID=56857 RepID=A0A200R6P6_MACCD|nr:Peptidase A1 [Macleaya cordata]